MLDIINGYENYRQEILKSFGIEDHFVKVMLQNQWAIVREEGLSFLEYRDFEGKTVKAVITNKNGEPQIISKDDFTLVLAIDCIKIGFIFNNNNIM